MQTISKIFINQPFHIDTIRDSLLCVHETLFSFANKFRSYCIKETRFPGVCVCFCWCQAALTVHVRASVNRMIKTPTHRPNNISWRTRGVKNVLPACRCVRCSTFHSFSIAESVGGVGGFESPKFLFYATSLYFTHACTSPAPLWSDGLIKIILPRRASFCVERAQNRCCAALWQRAPL